MDIRHDIDKWLSVERQWEPPRCHMTFLDVCKGKADVLVQVQGRKLPLCLPCLQQWGAYECMANEERV